MKRLRQIEGKLTFLLFLTVSVLCAGFFIVSCGNKPQNKAANNNKGAYAIDFSHCPAGRECSGHPKGNSITPVPDITDRTVTLEAWIKRSSANTSGTIFKRSDGSNGLELIVENNVPKFIARRTPATGDVSLDQRTAFSECVKMHVTSTECIVQAITQLGTTTTGVGAVMVIDTPTSTVTISSPIYVNSADSNTFTDSSNNIFTLNSGTADSIIVTPQTTAPLSPLTFSATLTVPTATDTVNLTRTALRADTYPVAGNVFTDSSTSNVIDLTAGNARAIVIGTQTLTTSTPKTVWDITVDNAEDTWDVTVTAHEAFTKNLVSGSWTHIAGVVTTEDQSSGPNNCAVDVDGNGMLQGAEQPHLAIYIDGVLNNCATTNSKYAGNPADENIVVGSLSNAAIDELRIWITARSVAEIIACKDKELGIRGDDCRRDNDPNLAAYYRFNEGEGALVNDFSGNGFTGGLEYGLGNQVFVEWEDGWVTPGAPITAAD